VWYIVVYPYVTVLQLAHARKGTLVKSPEASLARAFHLPKPGIVATLSAGTAAKAALAMPAIEILDSIFEF
jgi:hypothetical protein